MINQDQFLEKFERLPEKLQDLLSSDEIFKTIKDILNLMKIDLKYLNPIQETVEEILFLEKPKKDFFINLKEKTDLNDNQIQTIKDLVEKQIFSKVEAELNLYSSSRNVLENLAFENKDEGKPLILNENLKPLEEKPIPSNLNIPPLIEEIKEETPQNISETIKETSSPEIFSKEQNIEKEFPSFNEEIKAVNKTDEIKKDMADIEKKDSFKIPEIQKIVIEKPLDKTNEFKKIKFPEVSEEEKQKIKERLLQIMAKKKSNAPPKIIEEMKKISQEGIPKEEQQKASFTPKQKITYFEEKKEPISLITEEDKSFIPEEESQKPKEEQEIPDILNVKIKEFKKRNNY